MTPISLSLVNRQQNDKVSLKLIRSLVEKAIPLCEEKPRWEEGFLPATIEVSLLNNRDIIRVHADFLEDPTPTDVITFRHSDVVGEVLVGVVTAAQNAKKFGNSLEHEITLCIIHGLLHLLDYDDMTDVERQIMHQRQEKILQTVIHG